jgi:hypothetical protein
MVIWKMWTVVRYYFSLWLKGLRKIIGTSDRIVDLRDGIRTRDIPNKKQECNADYDDASCHQLTQDSLL